MQWYRESLVKYHEIQPVVDIVLIQATIQSVKHFGVQVYGIRNYLKVLIMETSRIINQVIYSRVDHTLSALLWLSHIVLIPNIKALLYQSNMNISW